MSEIKCGVVRDLMPLVADEVASEESKALVNEHMAGCEVCRAYYEGMTMQLARMSAPEEKSTFVDFSHRMQKRVRMKKTLTALAAAIVALCVVIVGVGVVFDGMNSYDLMPVEQAKAWLWRESGGDGDVNLLVKMEEGYGWYDHLGIWREGDILYISPCEPEIKLWNQGESNWNDVYHLELVWKNGQLYHSFSVQDDVYDAETDSYDVEINWYEIPLRLVRWGQPDNYTTLYEQGDMIPTYNELAVQLEGLGAEDTPEVTPDATVGSVEVETWE